MTYRTPLLGAIALSALLGCSGTPDTKNTELATSNHTPFDFAGTYAQPHVVSVYDGNDWVDEETQDCLSLELDVEGQLNFNFGLIQTNAHMCWMQGAAGRGERDGVWVYQETLEDGETCELHIEISSNSIVLHDIEDRCRTYYCGARGVIDTVHFDRPPASATPSACGGY